PVRLSFSFIVPPPPTSTRFPYTTLCRSAGRGKRRGGRAGSRCQIQDRFSGPRIDRLHDLASPPAVLAHGQDVVRQVVATRHAVEHARDIAGTFIQAGSMGLRGAAHGSTVPRVG